MAAVYKETSNSLVCKITLYTPILVVIIVSLRLHSTVFSVVMATDEEMEAERQSLYKAIGYAKGKALEPFAKEVRNMLSTA